MSKLNELKAKANDLFEADFVWYQSPYSEGLAIGIDWDSNQVAIVDLDHPDGSVIQDAGRFDVNTIYIDEEVN